MSDFEYRVALPDGELGRFVEQVWFARGTMLGARERIAPTGSTVLGIVLGAPILQWARNGAGEQFVARSGFLIGPHDEPIVNEPTAETWAVGIVTSPIGCRAALGIDPAPIRGRIVEPAVWPAFDRVRLALLRDSDAASALATVQAALSAGLDDSDRGLPRCERAVAMITADPMLPIADVAARLGVSHGHLDREFRRIVGIGPRVLARILRLRHLVESIEASEKVSWTALAAELGWFDQGHLIRDFRRFTGVSPSAYINARRGYDPHDATPGFVPIAE